MKLQSFLETIYFENTVESYLFFLGTLLLGFIFKRIISKYLSHLLYRVIGKKEQTIGVEKFDGLMIKPIATFIMLGVLYLSSLHLQIPTSWNWSPTSEFGILMVVSRIFSVLWIFSIFWIVLRFIDYVGLILKDKALATDNKMDDQLIPFAIDLLKVVIIILVVITVLSSVFEINVTAMAAGLGIGGIAIAMASKESLENLLGSFTIFFDRPFTVGDAITVGGVTGVVEKVGFRSTRVRTFDKSVVTVPNKNMVNAELDNLGARPVRRVRFFIGLTYDTSIDQIKNIVSDIQKMIDDHPTTNQDGRVRFQEFASSSLDILIMYFVDSPSWDDLIDVRQDINFKIIEIVNKHKATFAFPSTSVYIEQDASKMNVSS